MSLTLQKVAENHAAPMPCFFVMVRANGSWSPGTKILRVFSNVADAMEAAIEDKRRSPDQSFGVAQLLGEPREIANPIQMIQVETP